MKSGNPAALLRSMRSLMASPIHYLKLPIWHLQSSEAWRPPTRRKMPVSVANSACLRATCSSKPLPRAKCSIKQLEKACRFLAKAPEDEALLDFTVAEIRRTNGTKVS